MGQSLDYCDLQGLTRITSLNTQLLLKQGVWPFARTCLAQSSDLNKTNTSYPASQSFFGCPMHPTSSRVNERSSQYLIHLVILSNSQPRNQFLHIKKIQQKNFEISKQNKYIYIQGVPKKVPTFKFE